MRQLWPTTEINEELTNKKENEYEELVVRINEVAENYDITNDRLNELIESLQSGLVTENLTATEANLTTIVNTAITTLKLDATEAEIQSLKSALVNTVTAYINGLNAQDTITENLTVTNEAVFNKAKIKEVEIEQAIIDSYNFSDFTADNAILENADINNATIKSALVDTTNTNTLKANEIKATTAELNKLTTTTAEIATIENNTIETEYIKHNTEYTIISADNFIIELPKFTNGYYNFALVDNYGQIYLAVEANNSASNFFIKFSNITGVTKHPLTKIVFYDHDNANVEQAYFEIQNNNRALKLYYISNSLDNTNPPIVHENWPIDLGAIGVKQYEVHQYDHASLFNRSVLFSNAASDNSTLTLKTTDEYEASTTTEVVYDTTANRVWNPYRPNQSLNKTDDVEFNEVKAKILGVETFKVKPNFYVGTKAEWDLLEDKSYKYAILSEHLYRNDDDGLHELIPLDSNTTADKPIVYNKTTKRFESAEDLNITSLNVVDRIVVRGDSFLNGDAIVDSNLTIRGDLIVNGTTYTTDEQSVDTTGDYIVLRHNALNGLSNNAKSGMVVHNYDGNGKSAAIGVDNEGTFRVSDNAAEHTTTYTNISRFNTTYYEGLTDTTADVVTTGATVARDADEFGNVVRYNDKYYHHDDVLWFELKLTDNKLDYDIDNPLTDQTLIATLDTLDKYNLEYYRSVSVMTVDDSQNQPLLTREEADDLSDNAILAWDSENNRAKDIALPIQNNTVLTAKVVQAKPASSVTVLTDNNGHFWNEHWVEVTEPEGTKGTETEFISSAVVYNENVYYQNGSDWYDLDDKQVTDGETLEVLNTMTPGPIYKVTYTQEAQEASLSYTWKSGGSGSVNRFATKAEAEAALAIPEGQDGYIPNNGIIIVDEENPYVEGEDKE